MRESEYQSKLMRKLQRLFPGCMIIKNDPSDIQGMPDLTIFYNEKWAMLEVKVSEDAPNQPNQEHYVERMHRLSFASFIFPENEAEVLNDLQHAFSDSRTTRVS